ncbi:MAG: hypothetical protein IAE97_08630 [Chthoniobacterales bacterium]|nr:hypothetical protein [Chthoniobacterales bacterium]
MRLPPPTLFLWLALLFAIPSCQRDPVQATRWDDTPSVRLAPADSEGFLVLRRAGPRWADIAPAWQGLLSDGALRNSWLRTPWGRILEAVLPAPESTDLGQVLSETAAEEAFVVLGPGTATQLSAVQQVKRLFEAARLRNLFTPPPAPGVPADDIESLPDNLEEAAFTEVIVPLPPAMEAALGHFVENAKVPPVLFGAKIPDDSRLPALLAAWADNLPPQVPRDTFDLDGEGPFVRVHVLVANLVPKEAAMRARDLLGASIGDPYNATLMVRGLLAKTATISFGRARGYFLVSIGSPDGVPSLADAPENSLAETDDMQALAEFLGPEVAAIFHADALITGLAAAPPPVGEYLDAALESALEFAPARRIQPLRETAAKLRTQAWELFNPRVSAVTGIVRQDKGGWSAELFGGSLAPRLASENGRPLLGHNPALALLWTENWEEGYARKLLEFSGRLAAFSADWLDALGPDFLDSGPSTKAGAAFRALQGPAAQLSRVDPELWERALGNQVGLALDLSGVMPPPPLLPDDAGKASLPRVAIAADVRNRGALAEIWQQMTAAGEDGPLIDWPPPSENTLPDGGTCYEYPLPLGGPDLGLAAAVRNDRWVLATSGPFAGTVISGPDAGRMQDVQSVQLETPPFAAFASAWADALEADPGLAPWTGGFMPSDPHTLRACAELLQRPWRFRYDARWENDALRRTLELSPLP